MQSGTPNPWLSMWTEPGSTIRVLIQTSPYYGRVRLATAVGLQTVFCYTATRSPPVLLGILFLSPLFGIAWFFALGALIFLSGRLLGGKALFFQLRGAVAWSSLPLAFGSVLWFVLAMANSDPLLFSDASGPSLFFISVIASILSLWFLFLLVQSIKELQGFSTWRSILCCIPSTLIISLVLFFAIKYTI